MRIRIRRGTSAQWAAAATVLSAGELGLITDTGQLLIGDGTTIYNSLSRPSKPDVQAFYSSGTWTRPPGASSTSMTHIQGWSGGCGGGAGASNAVAAGGGSGGSSGGGLDIWVPTLSLSATMSVTIGAGGLGGASVTAANGNDGSNGGDTIFGTSFTARTRDTNGNSIYGRGGTSTGGGPIQAPAYAEIGGSQSGLGGNIAGTSGGFSSANVYGGACGGAGGGGVSATTSGSGGGAWNPSQVAPGTPAYQMPGTSAYNSGGGSTYVGPGGGGPGGPAGNTSGSAGTNGSPGGLYGGGGGGGGASLGGPSGAGAVGAIGAMIVTTII